MAITEVYSQKFPDFYKKIPIVLVHIYSITVKSIY